METVLLDRKIYREKLSEKLNSVLEDYNIDFAVLAGWLSILNSYFVKKWEGKVLNIHPSLLPDFGGAGMYGLKVHGAVLDAGRKESGCSVHIVTEKIDGGKVLGRRKVPVFPDDTPESLAARVLKEEHVLYPEVIRKWADSSDVKLREN
jgi:phosphoribosylglycinamide formyltransferase-1